MPALYPFDPVGTLPSNLIIGEQHVLTPANNVQYHFIVPIAAPFFADSLVVRRTVGSTTTILQLKTDYLHVYPFIGASRACAKPVYGGIGFTSASLSGIITIQYQTIGGDWVLDETKLLEVASNTLYNPRITTWEAITGLPNNFPVIDHDWNLVDMVGEAEVLQGLADIEDAILQASSGNINTHINNLNNPHATTKTQVGLGNVANYPMAIMADVVAGTPFKYVSADLVKNYVEQHAPQIEKATQSEVNAGTDDTKYTTPLTVKGAINSSLSDFQQRLRDQSNNLIPLNTKVQLALQDHAGNPLPADSKVQLALTDGDMQPILHGESVQRYLMSQDGVSLAGNSRVQEGLYKEDGTTTLPAWSSMQLALRDQLNNRLPFNTKVQLALKDQDGNPLPADSKLPVIAPGQSSIASPDSGNLLQTRSNGLYYGISAPPSTAVLYVDAINGDDSNIGNNISAPLKTLKAALDKATPGTDRTIRLYEGQTHTLSPIDNIVKEGNLYIFPYGPNFSAIPIVANTPAQYRIASLDLNTIIDQGELPEAVIDGINSKITPTIALMNNAWLTIRGINLKVASITTNTSYPINGLGCFFLPNVVQDYKLHLENCGFIGNPPAGTSIFHIVLIQNNNSGQIGLYGCRWDSNKNATYNGGDSTWKLFNSYNNNTSLFFYQDNNVDVRTGGNWLTQAQIKGLIPIPTKETNPIVNMKTNIPSSNW